MASFGIVIKTDVGRSVGLTRQELDLLWKRSEEWRLVHLVDMPQHIREKVINMGGNALLLVP